MTYFAQVTNNEITRINLQPPFSIPGVSLPRNPDPAFLATMGYFPMVGDAPAYDPATQRLTGPTYEIDGETVKRNYTVEDIPQEELDARDAATIAGKIEQLWSAADKYVNGYISGVAIGILTIGVIQSKPKCLAVTGWSQSIWTEYYVRKAGITLTSELDLDFTSFGAIPHSVPELQEEVFAP
jgi:hypothetical protein